MKRLVFIVILLCVSQTTVAQFGESPLSYQNTALRLSLLNDNGDAASAVLPSVTRLNGFASYLDNPAVMALADESFYSLGFFNDNRNQNSLYQLNQETDTFGNARFSNLGMVYKLPTEKGSLVLGGGYNLISNYDSRSFVDAFNNSSTITDAFVNPGSDFNNLAYEVYAIEYGDVSESYYESIFRLGLNPNEYRGITQIGDVNNRQNLAEYSLFGATEFQKNLYIGASIGLIAGNSRFTRDLVELDDQGNYDDGILFADDSGNGGTDIYSISIGDELSSDIIALTVRGGFLYSISKNIQIGAGVVLPSQLHISEDYSAYMSTEFDDASSTNTEQLRTEFDYSITRPGQVNLGVSLNEIGPFSFSGSIEMIDYSNIKIDLTRSSNLDPVEEGNLRENEALINSSIQNDYNSVMNLKGGVSFKVNDKFSLTGGYAYFPSVTKIFEQDRNVISGGFGLFLSEHMMLDVTAQYSKWDDRSILYTYTDPGTNLETNSVIDKTIESINVVAGVRVFF